MPVILRYRKIKFVFYSNDHLPIHVHAIYGNYEASCKVILSNLETLNNKGFTGKDLKLIKKVVKENSDLIEEAWNEFFKKQTLS